MSRKVRIVSVGRSHDRLIKAVVEDYEQRVSSRLRVKWRFVPHEPGNKSEHTVQIAAESQSILATLKDAEYVVLLDDTGVQLTTEAFSAKLQDLATDSRDICFVIGGAYGVDARVEQRADFIWSLGKLTLPHQLVRAVLVEQLYRATTIWDGGSYHHAD